MRRSVLLETLGLSLLTILIHTQHTSLLLSEASPQFQGEIPNGNLVERNGLAWAAVGHDSQYGGGGLNPFGTAFNAAGNVWTAALCEADSDGDGQSNGLELGDPDCVWTKTAGVDPARKSDISHPGFADSTTSATIAPGVVTSPQSGSSDSSSENSSSHGDEDSSAFGNETQSPVSPPSNDEDSPEPTSLPPRQPVNPYLVSVQAFLGGDSEVFQAIDASSRWKSVFVSDIQSDIKENFEKRFASSLVVNFTGLNTYSATLGEYKSDETDPSRRQDGPTSGTGSSPESTSGGSSALSSSTGATASPTTEPGATVASYVVTFDLFILGDLAVDEVERWLKEDWTTEDDESGFTFDLGYLIYENVGNTKEELAPLSWLHMNVSSELDLPPVFPVNIRLELGGLTSILEGWATPSNNESTSSSSSMMMMSEPAATSLLTDIYVAASSSDATLATGGLPPVDPTTGEAPYAITQTSVSELFPGESILIVQVVFNFTNNHQAALLFADAVSSLQKSEVQTPSWLVGLGATYFQVANTTTGQAPSVPLTVYDIRGTSVVPGTLPGSPQTRAPSPAPPTPSPPTIEPTEATPPPTTVAPRDNMDFPFTVDGIFTLKGVNTIFRRIVERPALEQEARDQIASDFRTYLGLVYNGFRIQALREGSLVVDYAIDCQSREQADSVSSQMKEFAGGANGEGGNQNPEVVMILFSQIYRREATSDELAQMNSSAGLSVATASLNLVDNNQIAAEEKASNSTSIIIIVVVIIFALGAIGASVACCWKAAQKRRQERAGLNKYKERQAAAASRTPPPRPGGGDEEMTDIGKVI